MILITGHRRENLGSGIADICRAVRRLAQTFPQVEFVYPVHPNPAVRRPVYESLAGWTNVHLLDPVPYPEFVWLMDRSSFIISDSGGVQEEAPALGRYVLVTRGSTERPEAIETGCAELVGTDSERIFSRAQALLLEPPIAKTNCPFGDGHAAERIINLAVTIPVASRGTARSWQSAPDKTETVFQADVWRHATQVICKTRREPAKGRATRFKLLGKRQGLGVGPDAGDAAFSSCRVYRALRMRMVRGVPRVAISWVGGVPGVALFHGWRISNRPRFHSYSPVYWPAAMNDGPAAK